MIVVDSREVCIALLFVGLIVKNRLDLVPTWKDWGKRDLTLCGLFNGDVGNFCGRPNFENKSCVSLCLLLFTFHCIFVFFVFLSSRSRVT
jgi:hypothetical protein